MGQSPCFVLFLYKTKQTETSFNIKKMTYPRVSSLLKFLCNGLIRGHDDKHLDGHVEDGHGDQVRYVVPVEGDVHNVLSKHGGGGWGQN